MLESQIFIKKFSLLALLLICFYLNFYVINIKNNYHAIANHPKKELVAKIEKKVIKEKRIQKTPTSYLINDEKADYHIENLLKITQEEFPDIAYEISSDCPKKFNRSIQLSEYGRNVDSVCKLLNESEFKHLSIMIEQKFLNNRLVEYSQHYAALEPISINLAPSGDIININLWIDGAIVFTVNFDGMLVSSFEDYSANQGSFLLRFNDQSKKEVEERISILKNGKIKLEKILGYLCDHSA